jgi:hypothetical protein
MCFRRQFIRKIWPVYLDFLISIICKIFFTSLTACKPILQNFYAPDESGALLCIYRTFILTLTTGMRSVREWIYLATLSTQYEPGKSSRCRDRLRTESTGFRFSAREGVLLPIYHVTRLCGKGSSSIATKKSRDSRAQWSSKQEFRC